MLSSVVRNFHEFDSLLERKARFSSGRRPGDDEAADYSEQAMKMRVIGTAAN